MSSKVIFTGYGINAGNQTQLVLSWYWKDSRTKEFKVRWDYSVKYTKNNKTTWIKNESTVPYTGVVGNSTFSIPEDATYVRCNVKPISKTYKDKKNNNKETNYFVADWNTTKNYPVNLNLAGKQSPDKPSLQNLTIGAIDNTSYIAVVNDIDYGTHDNAITHVQFYEGYTNNGKSKYSPSSWIKVPTTTALAGRISKRFTMGYGTHHNLCFRYKDKEGNISPWSDYVGDSVLRPEGYIYSQPYGLQTFDEKSTTIRYNKTTEKASIILKWAKPLEGYVPNNIEIEYFYISIQEEEVTDKQLIQTFENKKNNGQLQEKTISEWTTNYTISDIDIGNGYRYYFRIRGKETRGNHTGRSDNFVCSNWRYLAATISGRAPNPPTIWSSSDTVKISDDITLYWSHNSINGGREDVASIHFSIFYEDDNIETIRVDRFLTLNNTNPISNDDGFRTYKTSILDLLNSFLTDSSSSLDDTFSDAGEYVDLPDDVDYTINWCVKTKNDYSIAWSEASEVKTFKVYQEPQVVMSFNDYGLNDNGYNYDDGYCIKTLPFSIDISTEPSSQKPLSHHISISPRSGYDVMDKYGSTNYISSDDILFETLLDDQNSMNTISFECDNLSMIASQISYCINCTTTFDSGLIASDQLIFYTDFNDDDFQVFAACTQDDDTIVILYPYVGRGSLSQNEKDIIDELSTFVDEETGIFHGFDDGSLTQLERLSLLSQLENFEISDFPEPIDNQEDYRLEIFRQNSDGSFTSITGEYKYQGNIGSPVVDFHPNFGKNIYRIVGTSTITGKSVYTDIEYVVDKDEIVINWEENMKLNFSLGVVDDEDDYMRYREEDPSPYIYSGNTLILPYDIEISDNYSNDVSLVEYIGRRDPVSYYGTQKSHISTWNTKIPKEDTDTLAMIRRLAEYAGDCYVREPSGSGYWANIKVSFSQKYDDLTIPISLSVTRVEGGK